MKVVLLQTVYVIQIGDVIYIAGQIALVPGTMAVVAGSVRRQCRLALRHVDRLIKAMDSNTQLRDVVQVTYSLMHS